MTGFQSVFLQCLAVIFVLRLYRKEADAEVEADQMLPMSPKKANIASFEPNNKENPETECGRFLRLKSENMFNRCRVICAFGSIWCPIQQVAIFGTTGVFPMAEAGVFQLG